MQNLAFSEDSAKLQWERIGIRSHHGIDVPLFSLHSSQSAGIGEYTDLLPLIPWCHELGLDVIQMLPLNDTGKDSSPYGAISAFALNPIHLGLAHLPYVQENLQLTQLLHSLQSMPETKKVEYSYISPIREDFLRNYYKIYGAKIQTEATYRRFIADNQWLSTYSLYKSLKNAHNDASWEMWEPELQCYSTELEKKLSEQYFHEISYYTFVQYLCFQQMKQVKKVAEENQVFLKGDIPILINRDSADVWAWRELFDLNYSAGAPPDMYAIEGQVWGFPIYNWQEMERRGFSWWKERLAVAERLYHIYRLDHLVGFFRIWAIPLGKPGNRGFFIPSDQSEMVDQGTMIMKMLLSASKMMPIAEDLGTVPLIVRQILDILGICGTRVVRWERFWEGDKSFIPYNQYNIKSMTTVSTHDSEILRAWWINQPEEAQEFAKFMRWEYTPQLPLKQQYEIVKDSHHTSSLFHINLLQEYLDLIPEGRENDPNQARVNTPGLISDINWSYRFPLSVEQIIVNPELKNLIRSMLPVGGLLAGGAID